MEPHVHGRYNAHPEKVGKALIPHVAPIPCQHTGTCRYNYIYIYIL